MENIPDYVNKFILNNKEQLDKIYKEHIEKNNGFLSISINKGKKDPNKLYTNFSRKVEIKKDKLVTHKEQMPDRDGLPF